MGQVVYLPKIALSHQARVEVSLIEETGPQRPSKVIDVTTIRKPGQIPVHFALRYEPSKLDPAHTYRVEAKIFDGGKLMFATVKEYRVLEAGNASGVIEILAEPVKPG